MKFKAVHLYYIYIYIGIRDMSVLVEHKGDEPMVGPSLPIIFGHIGSSCTQRDCLHDGPI